MSSAALLESAANELPRVVLSDLALMELVGFNAHPCENGRTRRGDASRTTKKKQGPISAQCLADTICTISREEMERLVHRMVPWLARWSFFSGNLLVALDGSNVPTTASDEGCGKVKHTRQVNVKGHTEPVTEVYDLSEWNVLVLIEVHTRLPWALKLVPIQDAEGKWLVPLVELVQQNLGTPAQMGTMVVDRGDLDREDVWRIHHTGVLCVICGTSTMAVTRDAQGLAQGARAVRRGHGQTAKEQRLRTAFVG